MMRGLSVGLLLWGAACGGDDEDEDVAFDPALCEEIPFYYVEDTESYPNTQKGCDGILDSLGVTMQRARACNVDTDCQVVSGRCDVFPASATCWYAVNLCDDPEPPWPDDLPSNGWVDVGRFQSAYAGRSACYQGSGCPPCGQEPEVACVQGECTCVDSDLCFELYF